LLRLGAPNVLVMPVILVMLAMLARAAVGLIETYFAGKLGTDALAGMVLVFPLVMLFFGLCGFFGLGLVLYFASQGAGRLLWPVAGNHRAPGGGGGRRMARAAVGRRFDAGLHRTGGGAGFLRAGQRGGGGGRCLVWARGLAAHACIAGEEGLAVLIG